MTPDRARSDAIGDLGAAWLAAMRRGDLQAAWAVSDAVLAERDPATRDDPGLPYHLRWVWDGRPFDGRDVLVRCYHGLGDTLQFLRFLPLLRRRAARVALEVQPELVPLLASPAGSGLSATSPWCDRLIPFRLDAPAPPADCDIEIMELSHALQAGPDAAPPPYLSAPAERVAAARSALLREAGVGTGEPGGAQAGSVPTLVGLCWRAGNWDPGRSLPLGLLAPAVDLPGIRPVLLQRGPAAEEARATHAPRFVNPDDRGTDMAETAATVAALDLVVTVDTMIAHLAGALGRPAWVLLQADADWRWGSGAESAWYPGLRLFRQARAGNWAELMERVRAALARGT